MSATVTAADVKVLRERSGAGMMDCKAALAEADGDIDAAIEILRVRGQASAAKRGGRTTSEGLISSYIHAGGTIGVLIEVQCETDFVARSEEFHDFAHEVALHVAASAPLHVSVDEIRAEASDAERRVFEQAAREGGKPAEVVEKIVEGQLAKWTKEVALLEQEHVNIDKHGGSTIEELRAAFAAKVGENVRIARFTRFQVGAEV